MSAAVDANKAPLTEEQYNSNKLNLKMVEDTLKKIDKAVYDCASKPGQYDLECSIASANKIFRELPMIKGSVYPWANFDFKYDSMIDHSQKDIVNGASAQVQADEKAYQKQQATDQKALDKHQKLNRFLEQKYNQENNISGEWNTDPGLMDGPRGGNGLYYVIGPDGKKIPQKTPTRAKKDDESGSRNCVSDINNELKQLLAEFDLLFTTPIPDRYTKSADPNADKTDLYICPEPGYDLNLKQRIADLEKLIVEKKQETTRLINNLESFRESGFKNIGEYQYALRFEKQLYQDSAAIQQAQTLLQGLKREIGSSCGTVNTIAVEQNLENSKIPYPDPFFTDPRKPLTGKSSSSYFVKVGTCKLPQYKTREECESHQYTWKEAEKKPKINVDIGISFVPPEEYMSEEAIEKLRHPPKPTPPPGTCFKDRFAYVNNRPESPLPGSPEFQGLIPSMVNDFVQISPDRLYQVAMGNNVPGIQTQTCPEIPDETLESFQTTLPRKSRALSQKQVSCSNCRKTTIIVVGILIVCFVCYLIMGL